MRRALKRDVSDMLTELTEVRVSRGQYVRQATQSDRLWCCREYAV